MPDRLTELHRQRALIQDHLTWLDQEIAVITGRSAEQGQNSAAGGRPTPPPPAAASAAPDQEADAIITKFSADSINPVQSARKGCFIFFALALVLLGLGVYGLYLYSRSRH